MSTGPQNNFLPLNPTNKFHLLQMEFIKANMGNKRKQLLPLNSFFLCPPSQPPFFFIPSEIASFVFPKKRKNLLVLEIILKKKGTFLLAQRLNDLISYSTLTLPIIRYSDFTTRYYTYKERERIPLLLKYYA